jgi:hypothetical protein
MLSCYPVNPRLSQRRRQLIDADTASSLDIPAHGVVLFGSQVRHRRNHSALGRSLMVAKKVVASVLSFSGSNANAGSSCSANLNKPR